MGLQDEAAYQQGDIVVYNNKAAYKLNFDVKMTVSVVLDRSGEFLAFATSADLGEQPSQGDGAKTAKAHMQGIASSQFTSIDEKEKVEEENDLIELTDVIKKTVAA